MKNESCGTGFSPNQASKLDSTVITRITYSKYVVIRSGKLIEVRVYRKPIRRGVKVSASKKKKKSGKPSFRTDEYKQRSANLAQNKIRRLVMENFDANAKFLTLTFRDTTEIDIHSIDETRKALSSFVRKLQKEYKNFKYICVPEYQDSSGRGAVHFHLITNLPYIDNEYLAGLWGWGFIRINRTDRIDRMSVYLSKYLTKYSYDLRFYGKRKYITSQNLKKSQKIYGEVAEKIAQYLFQKYEPNYSNKYESHYNGEIKFSEYNLATVQEKQ